MTDKTSQEQIGQEAAKHYSSYKDNSEDVAIFKKLGNELVEKVADYPDNPGEVYLDRIRSAAYSEGWHGRAVSHAKFQGKQHLAEHRDNYHQMALEEARQAGHTIDVQVPMQEAQHVVVHVDSER